MLSNEARPVEMIATDERGCPRWVMCHWTDAYPERMLLLQRREWAAAQCYRPTTGNTVFLDERMLHEMPAE